MHIPIRMCVLCKTRMEKPELFRFVVSNGLAILDVNQKTNKRGTYVCKDCLVNPIRVKGLRGKLKAEIKEELWEKMKEYYR